MKTFEEILEETSLDELLDEYGNELLAEHFGVLGVLPMEELPDFMAGDSRAVEILVNSGIDLSKDLFTVKWKETFVGVDYDEKLEVIKDKILEESREDSIEEEVEKFLKKYHPELFEDD